MLKSSIEKKSSIANTEIIRLELKNINPNYQ